LIYKKYLYKVYVFSSFIFYKIDIIETLLPISNDYKLINYLFARDWLIYFSCIFIFLFTWHIAYINMQLVWNLVINYGDPCCITYIKSWIWILIFLTSLSLTATIFLLKLKLLWLLYLWLTLILDCFKIRILGSYSTFLNTTIAYAIIWSLHYVS